MDRKLEFNKALSNLVELAAEKSNTLTMDEIHNAFNGIIEDESLYNHIFKYLAENKISITEYIDNNSSKQQSGADSLLEKKFVEMYKSELSSIETAGREEHALLLERFLNGEDVFNEISEKNLHLVMDIIPEYSGEPVTTGDLIQEGNLGLIEGILNYKGANDIDEFHSHLKSYIHNAIKDAIDEQNSAERVGKHAADRANALDHAAVQLAEDLERQPTLSELSDYLSLPEDEVEKVMKMSLDALTLDGDDLE